MKQKLPRSSLRQLLFCAFVTALKHSESPCGVTNLTSFKGIITSPNYPSFYPNKIDCEWKIHSPAESTLKISIVDLDIMKDQPCYKMPCCSSQGLLVPLEGGRGFRVLCGSNLTDETIFVSQPITVIKYFSTSAARHGRGFQITYSIDVRACKSHELECINGKCVSNNSFCNDVDDCGDGSDERYCPHIMHTSLKYDLHPKKILDIENYIKPKKCTEGWELCPLSPDHCYSPLIHSCNDKFDCPKGEDEVGCVPACPGQISCSSGDGCYYPLQRCNLIRNCRDNSDETGCPEELCSALQFTCLNGACVSGSQICDGDDDCGDMSDEENCSNSSVMTVTIMGIITCIILFCLGLYRVYAKRLRAAGFVRQLEPDSIDDEFIYREPPPAYSVAVGGPGIFSYSAPQFREGYFENDQIPLSHHIRNPYNHRRRYRSGCLSEHASTPRSRPRPLVPVSAHGNSVSRFSETQHQPKINSFNKTEILRNRLDLDGVTDIFGFHENGSHCQLHFPERNVQSRIYQNESLCSSPTLSLSTESFTSSTSLEDHEDLFRSCRS